MNPAYRLIGLFLLPALLLSCSGNKHVTSGNSGADAALKKKYAGMMDVQESDITNVSLYRFIDDWYGVPYKYGGKSKDGVDCSDFVSILYSQVYKKTVSGSCAVLYSNCEVISEKNLQEGDLVFFKINSDKVSHVGIYLKNRHFVHATVHKGVMIDSLDEEYYKKYFFKGGRLK